MSKEKWLLGEVRKWEEEGLISKDVSNAICERYMDFKKSNLLVLFFSIIGTLLIGTGIILIFAKNWYRLPIFIKTVLSLTPLLISQVLSFYVLKKKRDSTSFREAVAIFMTASVFCAVAMIGQTFHLSGDYGTYLLTCSLIFMPIMFILDTVSPLIIYYYGILNWAFLADHNLSSAIILLITLFAGIYLVYKKRNSNLSILYYLKVITIIASFISVSILCEMLYLDYIAAMLSFFILLYTLSFIQKDTKEPFINFSVFGGIILLSFTTYSWTWEFLRESSALGIIFAIIMILISIIIFIFKKERDKFKQSSIMLLILLWLSRIILSFFESNVLTSNQMGYASIIFAIISNLIMAYIGLVFIIRGAKTYNLKASNTGLFIICLLVILRFFDFNFDFLVRGIVFLILGAAFLLINLRLLKNKKQNSTEVSE